MYSMNIMIWGCVLIKMNSNKIWQKNWFGSNVAGFAGPVAGAESSILLLYFLQLFK